MNNSKLRQIDIDIAAKVMQWPRRDSDDDRDYPDTYFSAYDDGGQIIVFRGGSQKAAERWSPAQDISAAMQVVEKIRGRDLQFQLTDKFSVGDRCWWAEFATEDGEYGGQAFAATPTLAICMAALEATRQLSTKEQRQ